MEFNKSQAELFCEGLDKLAKSCGMNRVEYNVFGPTRFEFSDGSYIGAVKAFMKSGIISERSYSHQYNDFLKKYE